MTTTNTLYDKEQSCFEGTEQHDFGVFQTNKTHGKREVGSRISFSVQTFVPAPAGATRYQQIEPGTYFVWGASATRAGEPYGAYQLCHYCKTESERAAQVAKYLKGAKARALRNFANT